jgi:hypothetical protein
MAKLTEPSADEIEVKREILTRYIELCEALPGGSRDIEACRSLLKELDQSPCKRPVGTTLH